MTVFYAVLKSYYTYTLGIDTIIINSLIFMAREQKQNTLINFRKAHSLLAKINKMVENKEYCINIMQQNLAVIGLLKSAHQMLMENHLNSCFKNAMAAKNVRRQQEMIREILQVTRLYNK